MKSKKVKVILALLFCFCLLSMLTISALAAGDVAGAVETIWGVTKDQFKRICNNVVFPVADGIIAVVFFIKLGMAYFDYKKSGQFEWTAPAVLLACLIVLLTAPLYVWSIVGF